MAVPSSLALIIGAAVEAQHEDKAARDAGHRIAKWHDKVMAATREIHQVTMDFVNTQRRFVERLLATTWGEGKPSHIVRVADATQRLMLDTISHLEDKGVPTEKIAPWRWQECALNALLRLFDADGEQIDAAEEDYFTLYAAIWGEREPVRPVVKLYELGERFVVAAYGRQDARDIIRREYGLVRLDVTGCADGAKIYYGDAETTYGELKTRLAHGAVIPIGG
jgi:hypothetical protein